MGTRHLVFGLAALVIATALERAATADPPPSTTARPKRRAVKPPPPPPAPEPTPPPAAPPSPEPAESKPAAPALVVEASPRPAVDEAASAHPAAAGEASWAHAIGVLRASVEMGSRDFRYVDRLTPTLRSYSLFAAPMARIDGEIYPLARSGLPVLDGLGVTADYAIAFALSSADASGASVGTSWSRLDVGARERIPLGRVAVLGLHGGYGQIVYSFDGSPDTTTQVPSVEYHFVRAGLDARFLLGALSLYVDGSYLGVLSTGPVGAYFPRETVGGVEARAGVAQSLGAGFLLSAEASYTRFFYTLNPTPGDAYVAGGALDQMVTASLGLGYMF